MKKLLLLSKKQRDLCKMLEAGRGRLFRMAFAWSHNADTAEEVVQETMIKALNSIDSIKNTAAIDGWLFRILSNCFIDYCRKQRDETDVDETMLIETDTPETIICQNEMLASVRTAIASLPFKHRQVITLVDIENFSYAEVAGIIEVPQGTVMSRLNRARQSLKHLLIEQSRKHINKSTLKVVR